MDSVIGTDNWPCAEDEHRLPYIRAVIKEVCHMYHVLPVELTTTTLGAPLPRAILDGNTTLHHGRICVQWDVHTQKYSGDLERV